MSDAAPRPTVLVVEDDDQIALLMQFVLEQDGYAVRRAANLAQARKLLEEAPPALASLDIMLPDGSGVDLIVEIRDRPGWERVPIMMVTSKAKDKEANWAVKAGARAYIVKPFKVDELRATVARLTKKTPAA